MVLKESSFREFWSLTRRLDLGLGLCLCLRRASGWLTVIALDFLFELFSDQLGNQVYYETNLVNVLGNILAKKTRLTNVTSFKK